LLSNGLITQRDYCNQKGENYRAVQRQWLREVKEFTQLATDLGIDPEYITRLKENLPLWRAPLPGQGMSADANAQGGASGDSGSPSALADRRIEIIRDHDGNTTGARII